MLRLLFSGPPTEELVMRGTVEVDKLDWPNAFLPGGWADVMHTFNLSGYGNVVVDAQGIVRGVKVHGEELERLVRSLTAEKQADRLLGAKP